MRDEKKCKLCGDTAQRLEFCNCCLTISHSPADYHLFNKIISRIEKLEKWSHVGKDKIIERIEQLEAINSDLQCHKANHIKISERLEKLEQWAINENKANLEAALSFLEVVEKDPLLPKEYIDIVNKKYSHLKKIELTATDEWYKKTAESENNIPEISAVLEQKAADNG
jgi:hypothetical protein